MKTYQLNVPDELWAWVKYQAALSGLTINAYLLALIERAKGEKDNAKR